MCTVISTRSIDSFLFVFIFVPISEMFACCEYTEAYSGVVNVSKNYLSVLLDLHLTLFICCLFSPRPIDNDFFSNQMRYSAFKDPLRLIE